jgi:hypothetical protein
VISRRREHSWSVGPMLFATTIVMLLCLASQAGGVPHPEVGRSRTSGPEILSIRVNHASLPSRGGTVRVTTQTTGADGCRLFAVGQRPISESLPRSWANCSRGIAKATIQIGANSSHSEVAARFRDYARRGLRVTWVPLTIIVHAGQPGRPAPAGVTGYTESTNWSGYVIPSSQSLIDSASGTWAVPTLNCSDTPNAVVSEWVGIGGVNWPGGGSSGALLQTGTEDRCVNGAQQDDAWWELYPSNPNEAFNFPSLSVSPGDVIVASVYKTAGGHWFTKVDDVTKGIAGIMVTGSSYGTSLDGNGPGSFAKEGSTALLAYAGGYSAEWIVEDSGVTESQLAPFADFGTVTFSNLTTSLTSWSLTPAEGVELVQHGVVLSTPEPPTSEGFAVRYSGP